MKLLLNLLLIVLFLCASCGHTENYDTIPPDNDLIEYRKIRDEYNSGKYKGIKEFLKILEEKKMKVRITNYKKVRSGPWYRKFYPKTIRETTEEEVIGPFEAGDPDEKIYIDLEKQISKEKFDEYQELTKLLIKKKCTI